MKGRASAMTVTALVAGLVMLAASCREPAVRDCWRSASKATEEGFLQFPLRLTDSLAGYEIDVLARLVIEGKDAVRVEDIPLEIRYTSPSGRVYGERCFIPAGSYSGAGRRSRDYRAILRRGLRPSEPGIWTLEIRLPEPGEGYFIPGMGIRTEKRTDGRNHKDK